MSNLWHLVHGEQNMISIFVVFILANYRLMTRLQDDKSAESNFTVL